MLSAKNLYDLSKYIVDVNSTVYFSEDSCFRIVIDQRLCLVMINAKTLFHCLRLIVVSQDEAAAALVTDTLLLCRRIYHMIGCSAVHTCAASGHTVYNIVIRHFYVDRIIHFLIQGCQGFVQRLHAVVGPEDPVALLLQGGAGV